MSKKEKNYEEAFEELQEIVLQIEEGDIGVDDLSAKVKRAAELIKYCKGKLKSVEADIDEVVKGMNNSSEES